MQIEFTKMHGTGNDFVVIDAINQTINLTAEQIKFIAHRHFGIGCDQLLLVEKPVSVNAEFQYRIFNADGIEVEQCGNGARCFARFVSDKKLTNNKSIVVDTLGGIIQLHIENEQLVKVDMGTPDFNPASLPFDVPSQQDSYEIIVNNEKYAIGAVSVGNPHAVLMVDSIEDAAVSMIGPLIEEHKLFPQRVNVGFMQIVNRSTIRLRVYERGVGETLACGTGACAAVAVGVHGGQLDTQVRVELNGGNLIIDWPGNDSSLIMTGPTETVFEGQITL